MAVHGVLEAGAITQLDTGHHWAREHHICERTQAKGRRLRLGLG